MLTSGMSFSFHGRAAAINLDRRNVKQIKIGDGFFKFLCTWHQQFNVERVTWNGKSWSDTDCGKTQQEELDHGPTEPKAGVPQRSSLRMLADSGIS